MKNYILLLCMSCFLSFTGFSQNLLLKGGLNFTNVSSEKEIDLSTSNGFHVGMGLEIPMVSLFNIGSGIYYTRRGYKSNEFGKEGNVTIDYLDIPIDLIIKFKPIGVAGVFVSGGPYFSYGVSSKVFDLDGILHNGYNRDDIDLARIDSGINVGAGVDIYKFRISGAYAISFTDNRSIKDNILKNRTLKLSIGYVFY